MIQYGWGDYDQTYLVVSLMHTWTTSEFSKMIAATFSELRSKDHNVNMIVDLRYSATPPMSILSHIARAMRHRPDNLGRVVVVSNVKLWKRLYESLVYKRSSLRFDIHFVTSIDEAYQLILGASLAS